LSGTACYNVSHSQRQSCPYANVRLIRQPVSDMPDLANDVRSRGDSVAKVVLPKA
jgi:hypothetical protein